MIEAKVPEGIIRGGGGWGGGDVPCGGTQVAEIVLRRRFGRRRRPRSRNRGEVPERIVRGCGSQGGGVRGSDDGRRRPLRRLLGRRRSEVGTAHFRSLRGLRLFIFHLPPRRRSGSGVIERSEAGVAAAVGRRQGGTLRRFVLGGRHPVSFSFSFSLVRQCRWTSGASVDSPVTWGGVGGVQSSMAL